MRHGFAFAFGILAMLLPGCGDPGPILPVTPPGAVIPRHVPEDQVAEALGETSIQSPRATRTAAGAELYPPAPPTELGETKTLDGGVTYETLEAGTGDEFRSGRIAVIHYEGKLDDGTVFDSSKSRGAPAEFAFGSGRLIDGWEMAVPGMKVGEVRKIVVPPEKGYGEQDKGNIPPNSTLVFTVELVGIK